MVGGDPYGKLNFGCVETLLLRAGDVDSYGSDAGHVLNDVLNSRGFRTGLAAEWILRDGTGGGPRSAAGLPRLRDDRACCLVRWRGAYVGIVRARHCFHWLGGVCWASYGEQYSKCAVALWLRVNNVDSYGNRR